MAKAVVAAGSELLDLPACLVARCLHRARLPANTWPQEKQVVPQSCSLLPVTLATSMVLPTTMVWALVAACLPHPSPVYRLEEEEQRRQAWSFIFPHPVTSLPQLPRAQKNGEESSWTKPNIIDSLEPKQRIKFTDRQTEKWGILFPVKAKSHFSRKFNLHTLIDSFDFYKYLTGQFYSF